MNVEKYYVLIAEGITDCSLLEAILEKYLDYTQYANSNQLPELFKEMIGKYPTGTGELKRQDSPMFYHKGNTHVAVKMAGGCSKLTNRVSSIIEIIDKLDVYRDFGGFLVFADTDRENSAHITKKLAEDLKKEDFVYQNDVVEAYEHEIPCKLHLFPTEGCGAIEKLLLECAEITYKELTADASKYREFILDKKYDKLRKECWTKSEAVQEFYADKVQFGAISTVLKPDKPVRFSIKDKLIRKDYKDLYMEIAEFKLLYDFLQDNLK